MAFALVSNVSAVGLTPGEDITSGAIDTTGADVIVVASSTSDPATFTVSDNKSNTYTSLTATNQSGIRSHLHYVIGGTVGSGHTFTIDGGSGTFPTVLAAAFSADGTVTYDSQENGAGANANTVQPGSVTPSENGALVISGLAADTNAAAVYAINSSFTITNQHPELSNSWGGALAYLIQGTAAAVNPAWSTSAGAVTVLASRIAVFVEDAGGGGGGIVGPLVGGHLTRSRLVGGRLVA